MGMITCNPETLNAVWLRWRADNNVELSVWNTDYSRAARHFGPAKQFEEWLFTEGAIVQQINGQRHLQFIDENQATYFLLRYA